MRVSYRNVQLACCSIKLRTFDLRTFDLCMFDLCMFDLCDPEILVDKLFAVAFVFNVLQHRK